ncbi:hypothetical protein CN884_07510 [Ochrobactrum sp. 30A/1000/2015]|nr:hypothetical protein CN884_07510 [Ochrobactrum sp. 30A/1000/2015]PJT37035.1 hypothetical protein CN883_20265 [Ochrobactrum sp. 27A/999/2015]PJT43159.1 hypothetical protein CN882_14550 [Ochrobactrum sp. 23A/997/2015]
MMDKPILFSAMMVRAILREIENPGTGKTQTRRVLKPQPVELDDATCRTHGHRGNTDYLMRKIAPRYWTRIRAGDRLWVREAWRCEARLDTRAPRDISTNYPGIKYIATDDADNFGIEGRYRQAMHMPRWASRITLEVTGVGVERLQDCSREDAIAEGLEWVAPTFGITGVAASWNGDPVGSYAALWDHINGPGAWEANPWVAAYSFRPILGNIDACRGAK